MNYLLYLVPAVLLLSGTALESGTVSFIGLLALAGATYLVSGVDPFLWIVANPVLTMLLVAGYLLAGALWARMKFSLWLMDEAKSMREAYESYRRSTPHTDASLENFKKSLAARTWSPARNKGRIMAWMAWWVPSVFWTLTHDFFQKIWRWAYDLMLKSLERATNSALDRHLKE